MNTNWVDETVVLLESSGRPLSARRIHKALRAGASGSHPPPLGEFLERLESAAGEGVLREVRPGVYAMPSNTVEATDAPSGVSSRRSKRNRKRRQSPWKARESFPAAPVSLDETAAMSVQADTPSALNDAVLRRMRKRAEEALSIQQHDGPPLAEGQWLEEDDPAHAGSRERATYLPKAGREPYIERRKKATSEEAIDRREPYLSELEGGSELARQVVEALVKGDSPMSIEALESTMSFGGHAGSGLKAALISENKRRKVAGLRRPFRFRDDGTIHLTQWCVSARYLELEAEIAKLAGEQREIVKRAVLTRISELDDAAFARFMLIILECLGYSDFEEVSRAHGGTVAISACQRDGDMTRVTAVVARKAWLAIDEDTVMALASNLRHFGATDGVLVTVGGYTAEAIRVAQLSDGPSIRLVDGPRLAELVYSNGVGLAGHRFEFRYLDSEFFESLER